MKFGFRIWKHRTTLTIEKGLLTSVPLSPDSKVFAIERKNGTTHLWDIATAQRLHTLKGEAGKVLPLAFSADGKMYASKSGNTQSNCGTPIQVNQVPCFKVIYQVTFM